MLITQPSPAAAAAPKPARVSPLTDVQLSHLRGKAGSAAAASCHAVRYRLNAPVDLIGLREKFEDAIKSWLAQQDQETETARMPKLWIEAVPGAAESPAGQRQRTAELMRPVELLDGPPCRAVLLQYQDRAADFIVVAHRAVLDRQALVSIAGAPFRNDGETIPNASSVAPSCAKPVALSCEQYLNELLSGNYS